jgi:MFS family permease
VTALLALHPGLYDLSLLPLTEPLVLMFLMLAYWSFFRLENPWVAGFAVALAFLTRPSSAVAAAPLALAWLAPSMRRRSRWGVAAFAASAMIGPALLIWLNRLYEAPALLLPQSYLFRVLDTKHQVHFFHEGPLYASSWALLSENLPEVARRIAKHGLYYARHLGDAGRGLGVFVLAWPLAWWGYRSRGWGRAAMIPVAAGALDLALYVSVWSTYDAMRFTSVAVTALVAVTGLGVWLGFEGMREASMDRRWATVRALALFSLVAFWSGSGVFASYLAWREEVRGGPYANPLEQLWKRADTREWIGWTQQMQFRGDLETAVIASNVPWLAHEATGMPSVVAPYDLGPAELKDFLERYQAGYVLLHGADWPAPHRHHRVALLEQLERGARGRCSVSATLNSGP